MNPLKRLRRRKIPSPGKTRSFGGGTFSWLFRLLLIALLVDIFYLSTIWPDWDALAQGPIPESNFIEKYRQARATDPALAPLHWRPVSLQWVPQALQRAVIVAEDARFYSHAGVDVDAFTEAMKTNLERGELRYGASTISQQTTKNLFLRAARDPLRKWHELVLTLAMETQLSKQRILEIYLNIAEFGRGVYGVEAAARHYWNRPVSRLGREQAIELAATLPSPRKHNPDTRTHAFLQRVARIRGWMDR